MQTPHCPSCGNSIKQQVDAVAQRWRSLAGAGAFACAVLGLIVGSWLGGLRAPKGVAQERAPVAAERVDLEDLNYLFVRSLRETIRIPFLSARSVDSTGVVVSIARPNASDPATHIWEALDNQQRADVVGVVGASYTELLRRNGLIRVAAFPALTIQYEGIDRPLGTMGTDGKVKVYASPVAGAAGDPQR